MKVSKQPATLPIHEYNSHDQHRIVVQLNNGECNASPWVPTSETACLGKLFAPGTDSGLEQGMIVVRTVNHRVLA